MKVLDFVTVKKKIANYANMDMIISSMFKDNINDPKL